MTVSIEKYGPAAIVTGASSGIGRAFAEQLAEQGFDLILIARRETLLLEIQNDLSSRFGVQVIPIVQDLTERNAAERIHCRIQETGSEIGLLINNAGYGSYGEFDSLSIESELAMIDLACRAMVDLSHRLLPGLRQRGQGGIIFVSSMLSQFPTPYMATYAAGKSFEFAFATALYGEMKPHGVDILALLPGTTSTDFFHVAKVSRPFSFPKATPQRVAQTALRALGRKPYVIDGWANKGLFLISRFIPMRFLIPIVRFTLGPKK